MIFTYFGSSTRGLDSSTALEFVRALRIATNLVRNATIVSIYQAGESLSEIFDKVCLLYEGRMVYFGPVDLARQYFIDMGYVPAARQTTPDFLVSVTNALSRRIATKEHDEIRSPERRGKPIPQTALEFEEYYQNSEIKKANQADIASYKADFVGKQDLASAYKASAKAEHARHTYRQVGFSFDTFSKFTIYLQSPYTISMPMQVRNVMLRRIQIMKGNYTAQVLFTTLVDVFSSLPTISLK